jgi:DNA (cytosine-5)-methyltransferase 1
MEIKYIDLFAGIGGFNIGFKEACKLKKIPSKCVFTSEIKESAKEIYRDNFRVNNIDGDITQIDAKDIPRFDVLLAGFPCQAFSSAGKRKGFDDTRGTLFFEIQRILEHHKPRCFILENVEGLIKHDLQNKGDEIGRTLTIILKNLRSLGYYVSWELLNSLDFGTPQSRKRIFIVGSKQNNIPLQNFKTRTSKLKDILESGVDGKELKIGKSLLKKFKIEDLYGKSIKDRRGGENNIHSWDLNLKGKTNKDQKLLLTSLLKARRNKKWAELKGIAWMDGMPLTLKEIKTFCDIPNMKKNLDDLVEKGYLTMGYPLDLKIESKDGDIRKIRFPREDLPKGYNIVVGKLSFEISNILDPNGFTPTLVATDSSKLGVFDNGILRQLTNTELKRLFGFPERFKFNNENKNGFDLFGNSISVNVVKSVSERLLDVEFLKKKIDEKYIPRKEYIQKEII